MEDLHEFHDNQCWFAIAISIAALVTNPFTTDPLNGFGLLAPSITGFLPQTFSLIILRYFDRDKELSETERFPDHKSLYSVSLCAISWLVSSTVYWALYHSLNVLQHSPTISGDNAALKHMLSIESCGGTSALTLCYGYEGIRMFAAIFIFYGPTAKFGIRVSPGVWAWCTAALVLLVVDCLGRRKIPYLSKTLGSTVLFYVASSLFLVSVVLQGYLFHNFINLGLINETDWSFGLIVAITTWVSLVAKQPLYQFRES